MVEVYGIMIVETKCKILQYADDTRMVLDGSQFSFSTLYLPDEFGSMSGLKVNYNNTESLINSILILVYPPKQGVARFTPAAISLTPNLHLARFMASFLLYLTSNSNAFLRKCLSTLLNTCPYHLTQFALAI